MADVRRLLDANANRAREAMRVMEDVARFTLDDAALAAGLKQLRHDLAAALEPLGNLSAWRDTPGDVGTVLTTAAEGHRRGPADIATAAGKRLSEALRCLEEFAKPAAPAAGQWLEGLRYRGYDLEARLVARLALPDPRSWRVCVLLSEDLCAGGDWLDVARQCLDAGADCLQLREKQLDDGALLERAVELVGLAREHRPGRKKTSSTEGRPSRPAVIVNDRVDVAMLAGADGVHLGQGDLPIAAVRKLAGRSLLVGVSTHHLDEAAAAVSGGADYCGVGAMFNTPTKRRQASGIAYLRRYLRDLGHTPHLAIGGITPDNIGELVEAGARAVAVSGCVCRAADPGHVVRQLRASLEPA